MCSGNVAIWIHFWFLSPARAVLTEGKLVKYGNLTIKRNWEPSRINKTQMLSAGPFSSQHPTGLWLIFCFPDQWAENYKRDVAPLSCVLSIPTVRGVRNKTFWHVCSPLSIFGRVCEKSWCQFDSGSLVLLLGNTMTLGRRLKLDQQLTGSREWKGFWPNSQSKAQRLTFCTVRSLPSFGSQNCVDCLFRKKAILEFSPFAPAKVHSAKGLCNQ